MKMKMKMKMRRLTSSSSSTDLTVDIGHESEVVPRASMATIHERLTVVLV